MIDLDQLEKLEREADLGKPPSVFVNRDGTFLFASGTQMAHIYVCELVAIAPDLINELREARQNIEELKVQLNSNNLVISHLLTKYSIGNGRINHD